MSGQTLSTSETRIEALTLQSSAYGVAIALAYGVTRLPGNVVWYGGFQAVPHTTTQGGKGGDVKSQSTTYTYQASVLMGLCHGPLTGITQVWRGKKLYSGGVSPTQVYTTSEVYNVPASGAMVFTPTQAANFAAVVSVSCTITGGDGGGTNTLAQGEDFTVSAAGVFTFLTEDYRGRSVTVVYQYITGGVSQTALNSLGLSFLPGTLGQAPWSALASFGAQSIGYSGLAMVGGQNYDLGTGAQVENHSFEVVAQMAYHLGSGVPDVDPSLVLRDLLSNARYGAAFPSAQMDAWATWSDYCVASGLLISPALTTQSKAAEVLLTAAKLTNTGPVWSGGRLRLVPYADSAVSGNGRTFTPNTTPVYDLDDECWLAGSSPLQCLEKTPADRFNHVRVQYRDRSNQYNPAIAEAKDQADIDAFGLRSAEVFDAPWVCTAAAARQVAQLLLQRALYVVSTYKAALPWHYALLEPMDLVSLADTALGMQQLPARILEIEETADGDLQVTFEEYPAGVSSAALYASQVPAGYQANYNVAAGNVDTPSFFESPADWTSTGLEVCVAVRGTGADWGGCQVWVSLDGTRYKQVSVVYGGARFGTLSAAATSGGNLAVQGLGSAQLYTGSAADAAQLNTLCYVGGSSPEYLAYQTATLTGGGAYTLSGLVRGAYGTSAAAHASGTQFVRVDERIAKSGELDVSYVGKTIYFKFTSFNTTGGGQQGLADVSPYTYTVTGAVAALRPGVSGKGLTLLATALTFVYPYGGYVSPSSITLTALRKGPLAGAVTFAVQSGSVTLAGSGDTRTIDPATMTSASATISAAITDGVGTYTDYVTISKVSDGAPGGGPGASGTQAAPVFLYQWSSSAPANPTGSSTYTWATAAHSAYTASDGWYVAAPANPGTPGIKLWVAVKQTSASALATTSAVDWSTGVSVSAWAQNGTVGTTGVQQATPTVWRWDNSLPTISGTGTYTWATASVGTPPSGWTANPGSGSPGQTLYGASPLLVDSAAVATTAIDWSTASVTARGYAGTNGTAGQAGVSARRAYVLTTATSLGTGTVTTSGSTSLPPDGSFSANGWSASPGVPASGQTLYQSDGLYNPATGNTTWATPYISALKVGNLAAIAVNTGALTVQDRITLATGGSLVAGGFSGYAWPAAGQRGLALTEQGLLLGNLNDGVYVQLDYTGNIYSSAFDVVAGVGNFKGITIGVSGQLLGIGTTGVVVNNQAIGVNSLGVLTGTSASGVVVDNTRVGAVNMLWGGANGMVTAGPGVYGVIVQWLKQGSSNPYGLQPGESLALSCDAWVDATAQAAGQRCTVFLFAQASDGNWWVWATVDGTTLSATRGAGVMTLPSIAAHMDSVGVGIYHQGGSATTTPLGTVYADRLQVERGTAATQYAPGAQPGATVGAPSGTPVAGNFPGGTAAGTVEGNASTALSTANTAAANASAALSTRLAKAGDTITGRINIAVADGIFVGTDLNNGVYLGNTGLVAKKAGVTTMTLGTDGTALFGGQLVAATGTFAGTMATGTATDFNAGTGFIALADGRFRAGSSTQYIRWTGSALQIKLDAISPSITGTLSSAVANGLQVYGTLSASVSGGTAPYTYTWDVANVLSGTSGVVFSYGLTGSLTGTSVGVQGSTVNNYLSADIRLLVRDSNGQVAEAYISHSVTHGTAP